MAQVLKRLKQQEYTGQNRCYPCTVLNLLIAFALAVAGLLAAALIDQGHLALPLSAGILSGAALVIYFRGYLVPGTPTLTKRYFPPWLLAWFDKDEDSTGIGQGHRSDGDDEERDPEAALREAGALEPCADVDDLCLTDDFAAEWRAAIEDTRETDTSRERLAEILGAGDEELTFTEKEGAFWARVNGRRVGTWESQAAFVADVSALPLLADRVAGWDGLSVHSRGRLLNGLRLFLEVCPNCGAELVLETDTVESCCRTHEVAALSCEACGARLFESDPL